MRTKALVIGARPAPWTGPRVFIGDGLEWEIRADDDYKERALVRYSGRAGAPPVDVPLNHETVRILDAEWVQVVLLPGIEELEVDFIRVNATCLRV